MRPVKRFKNFSSVILVLLITTACSQPEGKQIDALEKDTAIMSEEVQVVQDHESLINTQGKTLEARFAVPKPYHRASLSKDSYAHYLRHISLKPDGTKVRYFDGDLKHSEGVYEAVIDYDIGKRDLQQCADAVMRLRAEYLYQEKQYQKIHFNFTNGMQVDYHKWAEGQRVKIKGNKTYWVSGAAKDYSYKNFQKYLDLIYTYAGSASLSKELKPVELKDLQIGDVFIQGGFPGHAITVMDLAVNPNDKTDKIFILSQSYMPAQDIQILVNPMLDYKTVWYSVKAIKSSGQLITPEWMFYPHDLKRFE